MTPKLVLVIAAVFSLVSIFISHQYSRDKIAAAYERGQKDALNAEKPTEKLEMVCAALWFKGSQNQ